MNSATIKVVAIGGGMFFAIVVVNLTFLIFDVDDMTLLVTLVALFAAGSSVDFYERLSRRFLNKDPASENSRRVE